MVEADKRGKWMVDMSLKCFAITVPIANLLNCIGSVFYSSYNYGYINPDALYRPYRILYAEFIATFL